MAVERVMVTGVRGVMGKVMGGDGVIITPTGSCLHDLEHLIIRYTNTIILIGRAHHFHFQSHPHWRCKHI